MRWTKPDFQEITHNMEVTAYVNTEDTLGQVANLPAVEKPGWQPAPQESQA